MTFTEENYLKEIYHLSLDMPGEITTNAIAGRLNTKAATVTDMLKKLFEKKWIDYAPYQGVKLTRKGKSLALEIVRKHRLWEVFLVQKLEMSWTEVHEIAEQLEHIQSDLLIDRLDKFLGFPRFDPHGDPIPDTKGNIMSQYQKSILELTVNAKASVAGVKLHTPQFLNHLEKIGLVIGREFRISERNEFDDSMTLLLDDNQKIIISKEVSKNVLIA